MIELLGAGLRILLIVAPPLALVAWNRQRPAVGRERLKRHLFFGLGHGTLVWGLFVTSEWPSSTEVSDVVVALASSLLVGCVFALIYVLAAAATQRRLG